MNGGFTLTTPAIGSSKLGVTPFTPSQILCLSALLLSTCLRCQNRQPRQSVARWMQQAVWSYLAEVTVPQTRRRPSKVATPRCCPTHRCHRSQSGRCSVARLSVRKRPPGNGVCPSRASLVPRRLLHIAPPSRHTYLPKPCALPQSAKLAQLRSFRVRQFAAAFCPRACSRDFANAHSFRQREENGRQQAGGPGVSTFT